MLDVPSCNDGKGVITADNERDRMASRGQLRFRHVDVLQVIRELEPGSDDLRVVPGDDLRSSC